jgi:predicted ATPase
MEDLQWADSSTLDLIEEVISDRENHSLVFVCICGSDAVTDKHDFSALLCRLEDERNTVITQVYLEKLTSSATNELVSYALGVSQDICSGM